MTVTVKGGRIVTPSAVDRADLGIEHGRIAAVGQDLEPRGHVIDASGLLVMPGMVDTHVHLMDPGPTEREDFPTGTRAAAARGTTTIVEHTHAHPVRSRSDLAEKLDHLIGRANVDFGLAAHLWPEDVGHMDDTWRAGVAFFKMFTCTTHGVPGLSSADVDDAFEMLAAIGGRALVHCEDESMTARAEERLKADRRIDPGLLREWRSREAELAAVASVGALALSTGAAATLAHVSNPQAAAVATAFRHLGADLAVEACPQYFALAADEVETHGPFRKFTPPARITSEADRDAMWSEVQAGAFTHFSTDHAPSTADQKRAGGIWESPFGLPGLDTTYPFLIDAALTGRVSLEDVARLAAAAPAARLGLAPAKGALVPGADADFVLVDPNETWVVDDDQVISKAGWTPFAGRSFRGRILATYLRGTLIAQAGTPSDERTGRFLPGLGAVG